MCPFKGEYPKSSACMHTVHEFVTLSFKKVGVELCWEGEGVNEKGIDVKTGGTQVEIDINIFVLVRLSSCWEILWKPRRSRYYWGGSSTKTSFPELVKMMVEHDMRFVKKLYLKAQVVEWLLVYLKIGKFFCKKMEAMGKMKSYKEQNENKQVVGAIKYVQIAREERTDDFQ